MFDSIDIAPWVLDVLEVVANGGVLVLPIVVFAILFFAGGASAVRRGRALLMALRMLVDEPSDLIIVWYAKQTGQDPAKLSDEIKKRIDDILAGLPVEVVDGRVKVAEGVPLQERAVMQVITRDNPEPRDFVAPGG